MSCSAGSIRARASSGSRSSINSIEPLISANSAVTVLRSPSGMSDVSRSAGVIWISGAAGFVAGGLAETACPFPASAAPHSPQNFSAGSFSAPHDAHRAFRGAPHSAQNFRPSRFSAAQFEQRILRAQLVEHRFSVLEVGGVEALGEPAVDVAEHRARLVATALLVH